MLGTPESVSLLSTLEAQEAELSFINASEVVPASQGIRARLFFIALSLSLTF